MAAKSSNLGDRTSGANLQMEGHVDMPSQSTKDLGELAALGSSSSLPLAMLVPHLEATIEPP